jgi:glycine cleavage system transcriptional repressor
LTDNDSILLLNGTHVAGSPATFFPSTRTHDATRRTHVQVQDVRADGVSASCYYGYVPASERKQLVLTASGRDRVGIVEQMTELILRFDGNVESSRMVRLGGDFAMLMFVTAPENRIESLRKALTEVHYATYDVQTRLSEVSEPEETSAVPCAITVLGADHMGIIHQISRYLAEQGINLETMTTEVVAAPMSGSPLFTMSAVVRVPPQLGVDDLREALEFIGDEVGVDTKVFPHVDED